MKKNYYITQLHEVKKTKKKTEYDNLGYDAIMITKDKGNEKQRPSDTILIVDTVEHEGCGAEFSFLVYF